MAWLELHQSLANHPKVGRLMAVLGIGRAETVGTLGLLWLWALDYAPDGSLRRASDAEIAVAVGWAGDPGVLVSALVSCGWIEKRGRRLHDWSEYGEKLHRRRLANAERMRQKRAQHVRRTENAQRARVHSERTDKTVSQNLKAAARNAPAEDSEHGEASNGAGTIDPDALEALLRGDDRSVYLLGHLLESSPAWEALRSTRVRQLVTRYGVQVVRTALEHAREENAEPADPNAWLGRVCTDVAGKASARKGER